MCQTPGYLHLTKGATFSYYELSMPGDMFLDEKEWQETLKSMVQENNKD